MKRFLPLLSLVLCVAAGQLSAQEPTAPDDFSPEKSPVADLAPAKMKYVLIMPEEKTSEPVKANERNPFVKPADDMKSLGSGKGNTEENVIRGKMEKLKIVGVSPGSKGLRVMLGNMLLEPGELVPTVIPDQTLRLRVSKITEQSIELAWVEKKPTGMPSPTLVLPVDIRPYVRYKLPGQNTEKPASDKAAKSMVMGTQFTPREEGEDAPTSPKISFVSGDAKPAAPAAPEMGKTALPAPAPMPTSAPMATSPAATVAPAPSKPDATPEARPQEPEEWKRAVGFLNNLVKVEEPKK